MACSSCAKAKQAMRQAVASSSNRFGGSGLFAENPIILGEDDSSYSTVRVRIKENTTAGGYTFSVNETFYVRGSLVGLVVNSGAFIDITNRVGSGRVFSVGSSIYTSMSDANVASSATGLPIVEVG